MGGPAPQGLPGAGHPRMPLDRQALRPGNPPRARPGLRFGPFGRHSVSASGAAQGRWSLRIGMGRGRYQPSPQVLPPDGVRKAARRRNGQGVVAVLGHPTTPVVAASKGEDEMTSRTRSDLQIESYLGRVRTALRGLTEREIDDILRELQSHVVELTDEAGGNAEAALQSLGDPLDLAKTYRSENQLTRAECSNSPLVILQGLRHASTSRWGRVLATALYLFGYANVVTLWAAAIDKLSSPSRAGI